MRSAGWLALAFIACNGDNGKDTDTGAGDDDDDDTVGQTGDTGGTTPPPGFNVVGNATNLPPASILSIWGTASDNVWMVGADPDDGLGPLFLHFDGAAWTRLETGSTGDLWWIWSDGGDLIFLSGEGGRVLTYTISTGAFTEEVVTDPTYKLFGMWGTSPTNVWANGGDVNGGLDGIVLHYDGTTWTESTTAPADPPYYVTRRQAFKTWGCAEDDVWVIGTFALVMHWTGAVWDLTHDQPVYETTPLVTIHGRSCDDAYIVGGASNGTVVHWDGTDWTNDSPPPTAIAPAFNGVYASQAGKTVTCGRLGSIWWRGDTAWEADPRPAATTRDFHACWIDETGEPWAVGGDLTSNTEGVIVTGNPNIPPF